VAICIKRRETLWSRIAHKRGHGKTTLKIKAGYERKVLKKVKVFGEKPENMARNPFIATTAPKNTGDSEKPGCKKLPDGSVVTWRCRPPTFIQRPGGTYKGGSGEKTHQKGGVGGGGGGGGRKLVSIGRGKNQVRKNKEFKNENKKTRRRRKGEKEGVGYQEKICQIHQEISGRELGGLMGVLPVIGIF